jgi:hypothetical protein
MNKTNVYIAYLNEHYKTILTNKLQASHIINKHINQAHITQVHINKRILTSAY